MPSPLAAANASYRVSAGSLLVLGLGLLAYPLARLFFDSEIDVNEGWNAYLQTRAVSGYSIYSLDTPFFFNNYPPLSFYLVGALGTLVGDPVLAGRWLSLVAIGTISLASGRVVRLAGGGWPDAILATATCLLLFSAFATDYLGMNDPQLLGQAFIIIGLAHHLGGPPGMVRAMGVAAVFSVGLLIKHNMLALPLLVTLDILVRGPTRVRVAYLGTGAGLAALTMLLLWGTEGGVFFTQLLAPREWSVDRAFLMTVETLIRIQAPLAAIPVVLLVAGLERPGGLVLAYLGLALAFGAFFSGGAGTDINIFFDVFIALSMGAGLALHRVGERWQAGSIRIGLALLINAGAIIRAPLVLGLLVVGLLGDLDEVERRFRNDTAYLAALPGPALCQSHLLCLRAGKPMFFDSFNVDQAIATGRLPADTLSAMLERHEIAVLQTSDARAAEPQGVRDDPTRFIHFRDDVFDVLDREYVVDRTGISGRFFRPKSD